MIKFGPSGNGLRFYELGYKSTIDSAKYVKDLGLDCFEYSFGRGVNLTDEKASEIGKAFSEVGIELSVHAPYYINLANPEEENAEKSFGYIINSAKKAVLMGANRVVFHPASQGKAERKQAVDLTKERLKKLTDLIYREGLEKVKFCPETMGKLGQIGTIEEITDFCKIDKVYFPCVDFGHVNARENGTLKIESDYENRLKYMIENLGIEKMMEFHVHFSKIEYTLKGEVKHLTFEDKIYGPDFKPLSLSLRKFGLQPYVICESSGTQDLDAVEMKNIYFS